MFPEDHTRICSFALEWGRLLKHKKLLIIKQKINKFDIKTITSVHQKITILRVEMQAKE